MIIEDKIQCVNCGITKYRAYIPDSNGLDMVTLQNENNVADCCDEPYYEWVLERRN